MSGRLALNPGQDQVSMLVCSMWCFFTFLAQNLLAYPLWRFRKHYWMVCRWTTGEIASIIGFMAAYTFGRPLSLWSMLIQRDTKESDLNAYQMTLRLSSVLLSTGPAVGMMCLTCRRAFHQYYSAMVAVKVGLAEWRQLMDDSLITEEVSWFLRHKHTWGNRQFLNRISVVVWLILVSLSVMLPAFQIFGELLIYVVITVFPVLFFVRLTYLYPPFKDEVELRQEKLNISAAVISIFVLWLTSNIVTAVMGWKWDKNKTELRINGTLRQMWLGIGGCLTMLALSNQVVCNFVRTTFSLKAGGLELPLIFDVFSGVKPVGSRVSTNFTRNLTLSLKNILSDNNDFSAFMAHLFAEFSYENALCLIECTKFRDKVLGMHSITFLDDDGPSQVSFCEDVINTDSTLVDRLTSSLYTRSVAQLLAQKYLLTESPYQVNISSRLKNSVLDQLNDLNNDLDHTVFDAIIAECLVLLRDSLTRFKRDK